MGVLACLAVNVALLLDICTCRLQVLIKRGRFIEYGVFGKETSADWTIISNAKGKFHGESGESVAVQEH